MNNDISELTYQEKLQELDARLKFEKQYFEAIEQKCIMHMHIHRGNEEVMKFQID